MTDYLILVDPAHRLPEGFENTIELITVTNSVGTQFQIEKKTYEAFLRLQEDLFKNDGIQAELISVYRTVAQQEQTVKDCLATLGAEYTKKYVAIPGHSEHHTGLAIDVGVVVEGKLLNTSLALFPLEEIYAVIHKKLAQYGFILRYPKGKEDITTIGYEPWHFRYLDSAEIATEITKQGSCLEEWARRDTSPQ